MICGEHLHSGSVESIFCKMSRHETFAGPGKICRENLYARTSVKMSVVDVCRISAQEDLFVGYPLQEFYSTSAGHCREHPLQDFSQGNLCRYHCLESLAWIIFRGKPKPNSPVSTRNRLYIAYLEQKQLEYVRIGLVSHNAQGF